MNETIKNLQLQISGKDSLINASTKNIKSLKNNENNAKKMLEVANRKIAMYEEKIKKAEAQLKNQQKPTPLYQPNATAVFQPPATISRPPPTSLFDYDPIPSQLERKRSLAISQNTDMNQAIVEDQNEKRRLTLRTEQQSDSEILRNQAKADKELTRVWEVQDSERLNSYQKTLQERTHFEAMQRSEMSIRGKQLDNEHEIALATINKDIKIADMKFKAEAMLNLEKAKLQIQSRENLQKLRTMVGLCPSEEGSED
jgi:hypothetical protein